MKTKGYLYLVATLVTLFGILPPPAKGDLVPNTEGSGEVRIPLQQYTQLWEVSQNPQVKPAPADYALGQSNVSVVAKQSHSIVTAEITASLSFSVPENRWVLVPLLPPGTAVHSATIDGSPVQLVAGNSGLGWATNKAGTYELVVKYTADARDSEGGYSLSLPLPHATSTLLTAQLPGSDIDATIVPSAGLKVSQSESMTNLSATVPATSGVLLAWRSMGAGEKSFSRAEYSGRLSDEALRWTAEFEVELFQDAAITLPILPQSVTLSDIRVGGKSAPILRTEGFFAAVLRGRGMHRVSADFEVPIRRENGPPSAELPISEVPVSKITLTLPGRKDVLISPASSVSHKAGDSQTVATAYVPMTTMVTLSWNEGVPDEAKAEVRANASIYHSISAAEGVLSLHAVAEFEITRGETNIVSLLVPKGIEINRISSDSGAIADWRLTRAEAQEFDKVDVFLNRKIRDGIIIDIFCDRALPAKNSGETIAAPILRANGVQRQRGMIALLSSKELALRPLDERDLTRVGENQLPAAVRNQIKMTVAHTFKYGDALPRLSMQAATPERQQGRFDAVINTLVSLSDVTMNGSAGVELNIKSGTLDALELLLPKSVNVLSLTAPSLRAYTVNSKGDTQVIEVQFTQDMEGQFKIDVSYEFIMEDLKADIRVPTLAVRGAEVEQGRIAVEALSAVEIQPASTKALSSLELGELPQQLVLKTTNPILLAYKYVRNDPAYELALKITRHREIDIQAATIDRAQYRTLYTRDGIAVTAAEFMVRNTRSQFLRVRLPHGSKVWSAFVNGAQEKPALADASGSSEAGPEVLIKIVNSSSGFPVNLVYQTPVSKIGTLGVIRGSLPRPDIVVTHSHWDVYLPDAASYGTASSNMQTVKSGEYMSADALRSAMGQISRVEGTQVFSPLHVSVPTAGIRYSFEKLYANQSDEEPYFSMTYSVGLGRLLEWLLVACGAALACAGIGGLLGKRSLPNSSQSVTLFVIGAGLLGFTIGYLGMSVAPAVMVVLTGALVLAKPEVQRRIQNLEWS